MKIRAFLFVAAAAVLTAPVNAGPTFYSNGFETDTTGWDVFGGAFDATRVASGTNGIPSADGSWHAETVTSAGNWGGYGLNAGCASTACAAGSFPANGYITSVDVYLNVEGGWANNTRFDFSSAINTPAGNHRRDFIINGGFYNDADGSPGSGTDRFIFSGSTNSQPGSAFAKNPANDPIAISTTGWYTFEHHFRDDGGVLAVDLRIIDSSDTVINTWTRSDPTDTINGTVGANRYGWFDFNEFSVLAFDNAMLTVIPPNVVVNPDTGEEFASIQDAIDDADTLDGHTLEMLVDEHAEGPQIHFTKSLTFKGGSPDVIKALGDTGSSGDARGWFLVDAGVELHVEDLIFDGDGFKIWQGFRHKGSGSFTNCRFIDMTFQASGSPYAGTAIAAFGDGPVDISGCAHEGTGRNGFFYFGAGVSGSVCENNVCTGKGTGDHLDYGIELGAGAVVTVTNNTITDCRGVAASDGSTSAGILATTFFGAGTGATMTLNTFADNSTGVFIGFDGTDTSAVTASFNSIVGNDNGLISQSTSVTTDARENWWGDVSGPEDLAGFNEADNPPCFDSDFDPGADVSNFDGLGNSVSDGNVDYCPWLAAPGILELIPDDDCYEGGVGDTITIAIRMSDVKDFVVGGQFFLEYDSGVLDFVSATPGDPPFGTQVFELVNEGAGTIDYAVGVTPFDDPGTADDTNMAYLIFEALQETCNTADLVTFRANFPPTRLTNQFGDSLLALTSDLGAIEIDGTDPVITPPSDITVNADAGGCDAFVTVPALMASDNCRVASITNDFNGTADASDTYPSGTTTVTWTVTDTCGNESMVMQDVTVNAFNDMVVAVELQSLDPGPITRCITFELFDCPGAVPVVVEVELTFTGGVATDTIDVPCGFYDCITARDTLHSLRRTDDDGDFTIAGTQYTADFTSTGTTNDSLIGGNLNDDEFIDILDFGVFVGEFAVDYGTPDTDCTTPFPHADISGDGLVGTADFTFIQINFLVFQEDNCCGLPGAQWAGGPRRPLAEISVRELHRRGLGHLAVADLNGDGNLDQDDIVAFMQGARP